MIDARSVKLDRRWEPTLYRAVELLKQAATQHTLAVAAIVRGDTPDSSGQPLTSVLDLSGYFLLGGRIGGQIGYGDVQSSGKLTFGSTISATKGKIYLGTASPRVAFDEGSCFLGVGLDTPAILLHINTAAAGTTTTGQTGTSLLRGSYGGTSLFDIAPFQFSAGVYDTAIKPIAGVQIVGPDNTAAMRFVQTGSVAYIQTGIISAGGIVTNANMQLGGQGATYGSSLACAFTQVYFAASNTPTPPQFGVGVNPSSYVGTWKGVMAIVANSATEPALSLFPFNTSAGSVYMELRSTVNGTKYMSVDQTANGARVAFYIGTTLQGSAQPMISEFGGYKYAVLDAHDRRAMTFDSGALWNDSKTTTLIDVGDVVSAHHGAVFTGIDATALDRFAITSLATLLSDQFTGASAVPPRALVEVRNTKVDSAGNFTMPTITLVTGAGALKILQSDANGLGSWVDFTTAGIATSSNVIVDHDGNVITKDGNLVLSR